MADRPISWKRSFGRQWWENNAADAWSDLEYLDISDPLPKKSTQIDLEFDAYCHAYTHAIWVLMAESGADIYVFGRGFGHDTISDYVEKAVQRDTVRLLGLTPADIKVTADYKDNLVFTIVDTGETLSVSRDSYWWGSDESANKELWRGAA